MSQPILWLVFGLWSHRATIQGGDFAPLGSNLLLFVLLFLLGWAAFGFIVKG